MNLSNFMYWEKIDKNFLLLLTQSDPDSQTDRLRLVIAHQVVVQSHIFIEVLVLQSERLMRIPIDTLIFFQTAPGGVFAVPQEIAVDVGHLARDAELVVVEIGGFGLDC